jgi:periplasmic copper chaperone A
MLVRTTVFAAALLLALVPAQAAGPTVSQAWFRLLPAGLPAAGYFKLSNGAGKTAVLTGAQSTACGMLMLHKSERSGGMERMVMVDSVEVPPGGTLAFAPGGYHLMCMQPALKPGTPAPVTLQFADGSVLKADFAVRSAAGK